MKSPFPYFGGKSQVAPIVWDALGDPAHYIEPFFGSGAVLFNRPGYGRQTETVNDADGHICNVWRALQADPDAVAKVCDWPVNHCDLSARKIRLNQATDSLVERLCADDEYYDVKLAGYWIWACSCWIGNGLAQPNARPCIANSGKGVHANGKIPCIAGSGKGVHAKGQIPCIANSGKGVHANGLVCDHGGGRDVREPYNDNLHVWFRQLSERLRNVRVVCGDWTRVCGGNWQNAMGTAGLFFDPPYGEKATRYSRIYAIDSLTIANDVREWCRGRASNPDYRIVLAGYFEEHESLLSDGWTVHRWSAQGGYANLGDGNGNENRHREALFFSPHCLISQPQLFGELIC